jgi:hypothetical protein
MKQISNWEHLKEHGIICLTGEACVFGLRVLCDVTEQGKKLLETLFSAKLALNLEWNASSEGAGSIMLPYDTFTSIATWALLRDPEVVEVWISEHSGCLGITEQDKKEWDAQEAGAASEQVVEVYRKIYHVRRTVFKPKNLSAEEAREGRNIHQMTGRIS